MCSGLQSAFAAIASLFFSEICDDGYFDQTGGRRGTPEEIADVALFLATAAPEFLIGQSIVFDGGYTLH